MRPKRLLLALGTLAYLSLSAIAEPAMADPIGRVIEQEGSVFLIREAAVSPLRAGNDVSVEDRVVTAANGKVVIKLGDGSLCAVGPDSELILADLGAAEDGWMDLVRGIVRLVLVPGVRGSEAGVRSRAAVASVRSTEFIMESTLDHAAVFVAEGAVQVTGRLTGAWVTIRSGEGTDVGLREPPTPPKRWGQARIDDVISRTSLP